MKHILISLENDVSDIAVQDLNADQLASLVAKAGGQDQVLRILSGEIELQLLEPAPVERFVTVPAGVAFEKRIARGDYGWRNPDLTEARFPVTADQAGDFEQKLFHFNRGLSSAQAMQEIREAGYAPGQIGDVLAFGERFPQEQRRHPVIGLGSAVLIDGSLAVPGLWFDGHRRTVDLIWYDGDWHRNYRFIGVRKSGRA